MKRAARALALLGLSCCAGAALLAGLGSPAATATLATPAAPLAAAVDASAPASCEPTDRLTFVCGAERPEDLALIPGTRWLIASGFANGAGLKLVDTEARVLRLWYTGEPAQVRHDTASYPECPGAPDASSFNVQGISLRSDASGIHTLHAANHGGREAIEVFHVDAPGAEPALTWIGCIVMPDGMAANSVATFPDGSVIATVLTRPGTQIADFVQGRTTGLVYEWKPGTRAFRHVQGADLPGNNGIEASRDGKEFYVVAFGMRAVLAFSHTNPARLLRKAVAPGFMPDNIHWDGERLLVAGMQYDEPACGGLRRIIDGKADPMLCHRGYVVARLDSQAMTYSVVAYSEPDRAFSGVSTGVIVGSNLWLGSFQSDRIAFRPLPVEK